MDVWGHRALCALLVLGCLTAGVTPTAAADHPGVAPNAAQADEPSLNGYDALRVAVDVEANGSATWTLEYQYRLDDDDASERWDALRRDVEDRPDAYTGMIEDRWSETAVEAEQTTERDMSTSNYGVEVDETQTPEEYGYVRFTFEWNSFAHVEVNRIEVGDAIEGFELGERTQLIVSWPATYDVAGVEPSPDDARNTAVVWDGQETTFIEEDEPRIELLRGDPDAGDGSAGGLVPLAWMAVGGLTVLALAGAAGWWVVRDDGSESEPEPTAPSSGAVADADEPPPNLLSNEERVLRLVETRGGRMKQQEIVTELGWTEAKTSQVVSGLREDDAIEVFRIGRENVLALPDEERA